MDAARVGATSREALKALQDAAIREVVAFQERCGLAVVTDGEFRHATFHHFLEQIDGVIRSPVPTGDGKKFQPRGYSVLGKIRHVRPIEVESFKFLRSVTRMTPKVTLPSPTMLLRANREDISQDAYPDLNEYFADVTQVYREEMGHLYAAGCRYFQFDDTNLAYLCDPELRKRPQLAGNNPDEILRRSIALINDAIGGQPADISVGVHICRGNLAGTFAAQGGYEPIADALLNELDVDGYFLEYDDARSGGFEPLRFFPKSSKKKIVLGLVSSKRPELESPDELARRVDEASKYVPLENLCISPQCGFASVLKGNPISEDVQRRKVELVVETAHRVWGNVQ